MDYVSIVSLNRVIRRWTRTRIAAKKNNKVFCLVSPFLLPPLFIYLFIYLFVD